MDTYKDLLKHHVRPDTDGETRLATVEMMQGHYLDLTALLSLIPEPNHKKLWKIIHDYEKPFAEAQGSSNNHQAWVGGYLDHVVEVMNIACQQYLWMNNARKLPFELSEALEVMFLHDIEKPFKQGHTLMCNGVTTEASKDNRKKFRSAMIERYEIRLSWDQDNALRYVEGVPDSEYTPGMRTMGELAAFCHCCDILSARLWWDRGHYVPAPAWSH